MPTTTALGLLAHDAVEPLETFNMVSHRDD